MTQSQVGTELMLDVAHRGGQVLPCSRLPTFVTVSTCTNTRAVLPSGVTWTAFTATRPMRGSYKFALYQGGDLFPQRFTAALAVMFQSPVFHFYLLLPGNRRTLEHTPIWRHCGDNHHGTSVTMSRHVAPVLILRRGVVRPFAELCLAEEFHKKESTMSPPLLFATRSGMPFDAMHQTFEVGANRDAYHAQRGPLPGLTRVQL